MVQRSSYYAVQIEVRTKRSHFSTLVRGRQNRFRRIVFLLTQSRQLQLVLQLHTQTEQVWAPNNAVRDFGDFAKRKQNAIFRLNFGFARSRPFRAGK